MPQENKPADKIVVWVLGESCPLQPFNDRVKKEKLNLTPVIRVHFDLSRCDTSTCQTDWIGLK